MKKLSLNLDFILEVFKMLDLFGIIIPDVNNVKAGYEKNYNRIVYKLSNLLKKLAYKVLDEALSEIDFEDHIIPRYIALEKIKTSISFDGTDIRYNNILDEISDFYLQPWIIYLEEDQITARIAKNKEALKKAILEAKKINYKYANWWVDVPNEEEILQEFKKNPLLDLYIIEATYTPNDNGGYLSFDGHLYVSDGCSVKKYEYVKDTKAEWFAKNSNSIKELLRTMNERESDFESFKLVEEFTLYNND